MPEPDTVPPTSAPSQPQNPFAKWLIGLSALTILIVGGPIALWAQTDTAGKRVSVEAVQLQKLQDQLKGMEQTMQVLVGGQQAGAVTDMLKAGVSCRTEEGRAECLNDCRRDLASCKAKNTGETNPADEGGLDPCLSDANSCISQCNDMPRPPISCQDRCAVALGGCLEFAAASTASSTVGAANSSAIDTCRKNNRTCLVKACKLKNEDSIPADACPDQCKRLEAVCNAGSASYSKEAMALCDKLKTLCQNGVCKNAPAAGAVKTEKPTPVEETVSSCNDQQAYVCDKIKARCLEHESETGCDAVLSHCQKTCVSCTADDLVACHDKYAKCDTASCFNEIANCFDSCGKAPVPKTVTPPTSTGSAAALIQGNETGE